MKKPTKSPKTPKVHLLVKFNDNWADEFDVEGFEIWEQSKWKAHLEAAKEFIFPRTLSFGSNQDNEYYDFDHYARCFSTKKLTETERKTLVKLFGGETYGTFKILESWD